MLIANYSYINQICGHNHSGVTNPTRSISPQTMRGYYSGSSVSSKDSFPTGTNPPYSYILGDKGSLLSSTTLVNGSGVFTSNMAMGKALSAELYGSGEITSALSLIAQIGSNLNGSGNLTGSLIGVLQLASDLIGSGDLIGGLSLITNISSNLEGRGSVISGLRGTLSLDADITPFTTLSPENLANAVWSKALEGAITAEEIMRLLSAVSAGKSTIIDLGGGLATVTFRDINDTEDRVIADMTNSERTTVTKNL